MMSGGTSTSDQMQAWLAAARCLLTSIDDDLLCQPFDTYQNSNDITTAILAMNGLAVRGDCPRRFFEAANTRVLVADGVWGPKANAALKVLEEMVSVPNEEG